MSALAPPASPQRLRWPLPRSLFARVTLLIVVGLAVAQLLAFASLGYERGLAMRDLMMTGIERDIASSVAILDRLPAGERAGWLQRLERRNYRFTLEAAPGELRGEPPRSEALQQFGEAITRALHPYPVVTLVQVPGLQQALLLQVRLGDGRPLFVHARRVPMPVSEWVLWGLLVQLAVLAGCAWAAVRLVTRPLSQLADAADRLGPDLQGVVLEERGPSEVVRAARAFNAMQRRIAGHVHERVEILAAISHDLQTPLTRLRLRADLMDDDSTVRDKIRRDVDDMQSLVKEGLAYARTLHGAAEPPCRLDVRALLDSLADDQRDLGREVALEGDAGPPMVTRPLALRRILGNLVDNAFKYGQGGVRLQARRSDDTLTLAVLDDGPGIPPEELEAVLRPFHRLEGSRNRGSGGTGLGLAIAHQLALAMGATLTLHNRPQGGLEARVVLTT